MKVVNSETQSIDYRLNIMGIRIWQDKCQLIARHQGRWAPLGPRHELPVFVPRTREQLQFFSDDPLRLTAYQYTLEHPDSDIPLALGKSVDFGSILRVPAVIPAE